MKLANCDINKVCPLEIKFPPVVVDQTNFRISEIIKRNKAGEQVLGDKNMQYDFDYRDEANFEKVNPLADFGFDLDDVIHLADKNAVKVTDLQNRLGELKLDLDTSKEDEPKTTPQASPQETKTE